MAATAKERISRLGQRRLKRKGIVAADDILTPKEARLVRQGEAQLKRGTSKSWRAVKNALAR